MHNGLFEGIVSTFATRAGQSMAVDWREVRLFGVLYGAKYIFLLRSARGCQKAWPPDGHALRGGFALIPRGQRAATDVSRGLNVKVLSEPKNFSLVPPPE